MQYYGLCFVPSDIYLLLLMVLSTTSVITSVCILNIHGRAAYDVYKVPNWVRILNSTIMSALILVPCDTKYKHNFFQHKSPTIAIGVQSILSTHRHNFDEGNRNLWAVRKQCIIRREQVNAYLLIFNFTQTFPNCISRVLSEKHVVKGVHSGDPRGQG